MSAGAFNGKKSWDTGKNYAQHLVRLAQERLESEKRKLDELKRQIQEERELEQLHRQRFGNTDQLKTRSMDWIYQAPSDSAAKATLASSSDPSTSSSPSASSSPSPSSASTTSSSESATPSAAAKTTAGQPLKIESKNTTICLEMPLVPVISNTSSLRASLFAAPIQTGPTFSKADQWTKQFEDPLTLMLASQKETSLQQQQKPAQSSLSSLATATPSTKITPPTVTPTISSATVQSFTSESSTPLSSTPLSSTPLSSTPLSSTPLSSTSLSSTSLSSTSSSSTPSTSTATPKLIAPITTPPQPVVVTASTPTTTTENATPSPSTIASDSVGQKPSAPTFVSSSRFEHSQDTRVDEGKRVHASQYHREYHRSSYDRRFTDYPRYPSDHVHSSSYSRSSSSPSPSPSPSSYSYSSDRSHYSNPHGSSSYRYRDSYPHDYSSRHYSSSQPSYSSSSRQDASYSSRYHSSFNEREKGPSATRDSAKRSERREDADSDSHKRLRGY